VLAINDFHHTVVAFRPVRATGATLHMPMATYERLCGLLCGHTGCRCTKIDRVVTEDNTVMLVPAPDAIHENWVIFEVIGVEGVDNPKPVGPGRNET